GDERASLAALEAALAIWERAGDRGSLAGGLLWSARARLRGKDPEGALPLATRALAMREAVGNPAEVAMARLGLAAVLTALRRFPDALREAEAARAAADRAGRPLV